MGKRLWLILALGMLNGIYGQDAGALPPDMRSHNLLYMNPSVFNPAFAMDQQVPHRINLWSRWQWQTPDTDPTTLLVNYTARSRSYAYGGGFFQNNTSFYRQTGGLLNFAFDIPLGEKTSITFGANLLGFMQELSDNRFFLNEPVLPFSDNRDEFILQLAPAIQFNFDRFGLAFTSDNLFDFNVTRSGAETESNEKIISGLAHYSFPLEGGDPSSRSFVRPVLYVKSLPGYDTQYGLQTVWAAPRFWVQAGYNSFYGPSAGIGGRFMQRFRLGALVEMGTDNAPEGDEFTFELMASIDLGPTDGRKKVVGFEVPEPSPEEILEEEARRDSIARAAAQREMAQQRVRDSLDAVQRAAELAEARRVRDSLQQAEEKALALEREVVPEEGERYQEVSAEEGLAPGFYLIANVFGTQKYFEAFMEQLRRQGLEPKSFYRAANSYNYVYLKRYDSIQEARRARDSKFGGAYQGDLWIFRVR